MVIVSDLFRYRIGKLTLRANLIGGLQQQPQEHDASDNEERPEEE